MTEQPPAAPQAAAVPGSPADEPDGRATARAARVLAPNPGPMTLDGTNTWILAEPGADAAVVVDPGPDDPAHLRRVAETAEEGGRRTALILLTHGHPDHTEGADRFAELTGAPVRAADPALLRGGGTVLEDGEVIRTAGLRLRVLRTRGHTEDSVCLLLPADRALLSGDSILGRGTSIIARPDGRLGDYLDTLRRLRSLAEDGHVRTVLPGHGPVLADALGVIDYYLAHRAARLAQVETSYEAGHRTAAEVVADVYAQTDRALWPAAEQSVQAQLDYLDEHGLI